MHICDLVVNSVEYLKCNGFIENQITELHHFSLIGKQVRYASLLKYFSVHKNLQSNNQKVADRINYVAEQHKLKSGNFSQLIKQALLKWPLNEKSTKIKSNEKSNDTGASKNVVSSNSSGIYIVTLNNKLAILNSSHKCMTG